MTGERIPERFPEIVAEYRDLGYCDDDIARRMRLSTETLYRRFDRLGIPHGRRWRDIEDAHADRIITKAEARRYRRADA